MINVQTKNKPFVDMQKISKDFTILDRKVNRRPLVYLDSAATSLTPDQVIEAMDRYYKDYNANVHRGVHELSQVATREYESAHEKVAEFINASPEEIIFTSGTTSSINMLARSLGKSLKKGDEIAITEMEHHSNMVPWQQLAKEKQAVLKFIKVNLNGELDLKDAKLKITKRTKIVSATHMSNVLGTINDVKLLGELAHSNGSLFVVDGAQSVAHMPIDVKRINCDFFAFSGHKLMGPTGIGVLYGKADLLSKMSPSVFGGGMISEVKEGSSKWNDLPWKFEAGTPNISGAIGLGAAVDYLRSIGMANVEAHLKEMTKYALEKLSELKGLKVYGPKDLNKIGPVISFNFKGIHPHDVSAILNREGIAIRGGHMCAMPLVTEVLKENAVCRISIQIYNKKEDIDSLINSLGKVQEIFKK